jgi:hypothetical protein
MQKWFHNKGVYKLYQMIKGGKSNKLQIKTVINQDRGDCFH